MAGGEVNTLVDTVDTWLAFIIAVGGMYKLMYGKLAPLKKPLKRKDKAEPAIKILELLNAVPMSWRFFSSASRAMSQMCLWPDPYKDGSWMALNGGGSFMVWSAAAVSPTPLQALRHGIIGPLELWIAYVGFEKADQRPYEKLLVALLLIGCLPSLMQAGASVFYVFPIALFSLFPPLSFLGLWLFMMVAGVIVLKLVKLLKNREYKKKKIWEKPPIMQFEEEHADTNLSCSEQYSMFLVSEAREELREQIKRVRLARKAFMQRFSTAIKVYYAVNGWPTFAIFFAMPLAEFSVWSQTALAHYGVLGWLPALQEIQGDWYDRFFETRPEFIFPKFFAFWDNLDVTTVAGQLRWSILLDVITLALEMLPDESCIERGREKVADYGNTPSYPVPRQSGTRWDPVTPFSGTPA